MSEEYRHHFPVAVWSRDGHPILSPPTEQLFRTIRCKGTALVAHFLTEFFDPWSYFYDNNIHGDPRVMLPTRYRVEDLAVKMGWTDRLVDDRLAGRLILFRPTFRMLAAAVRVSDQDITLPGDDQLFAEVMAEADQWDLRLPELPAVVVGVQEGGGHDVRLRQAFLDACGGLDAALLSMVLGRCVANRSWDSLHGWLIMGSDTLSVKPTWALFTELRKQLAGSEHPHMAGGQPPFCRQWWLEDLITARLQSACVPSSVAGCTR